MDPRLAKKERLVEAQFKVLVEEKRYTELALESIGDEDFVYWFLSGLRNAKDPNPWYEIINHFQRDSHLVRGLIHDVLSRVDYKTEMAFVNFILSQSNQCALKALANFYCNSSVEQLKEKIPKIENRLKLYFYIFNDYVFNFDQSGLKEFVKYFDSDKALEPFRDSENYVAVMKVLGSKESQALRSMSKEEANYRWNLMRKFESQFSSVDYEGFRLACAQIQARKKYHFNPIVLNDIIEFPTLLEDISRKNQLRTRFAIGGGHWLCGDIQIKKSRVSILLIDSMGPGKLNFNLVDHIKKVFPKAVIYVSANKRQFIPGACSVFAVDDLRHLYTVEKYLAPKYERNLFKYLEDHASTKFLPYLDMILREVQLPLGFERTMTSSRLFGVIESSAYEEQKLPVGKRGKTALQTADESFFGKRNLRLQKALEKIINFNYIFLQKSIQEIRERMNSFKLDTQLQRANVISVPKAMSVQRNDRDFLGVAPMFSQEDDKLDASLEDAVINSNFYPNIDFQDDFDGAETETIIDDMLKDPFLIDFLVEEINRMKSVGFPDESDSFASVEYAVCDDFDEAESKSDKLKSGPSFFLSTSDLKDLKSPAYHSDDEDAGEDPDSKQQPQRK